MSQNAVERFYHEGRKAFYRYQKIKKGHKNIYHASSNPYTSNSFRGKEWERGYNSSYFQQLERITGD
jgi:hypothetical protein|tara:strand:+ start:763 stop:963 length:201 start_codon:yes stop_codon:yes gene_type:complete